MNASEHLDDEELSATVDDEGAPAHIAHLGGCAPCTARYERLLAVTHLVATPPPSGPDARREQAVAAALGAFRASPVEPTASSGTVVRRLRPRPARWRPPSWLLPAAAVVALFALVVPLLASLGGRTDGDDAATGAMSESADEGGDGAESTVASGALGAFADGGDLGVIGSDTDLEALTGPALRAVPPENSPEGGADDGELSQAARACAERLRAEDATLGELRYVARATWDGQPAVVLAFTVPGAQRLDARVHVRTAPACEPLTVVSFASG